LVRFTTVAALVNELLEARDERTLSRAVGRWSCYDLVVCDELGYVTLPPTGAELLFQVLAQRADAGSVVVTTNLPFSEWTTVFSDLRLCKAVVERLTYRSHIVEKGNGLLSLQTISGPTERSQEHHISRSSRR
jgi:DNA replication protein DnaC